MTTDNIRLFFALWPDPQTRKQLQLVADQLQLPAPQGRRVATANLHITLHFIGNTTQSNRQCLDHQASQLTASPFTISLDTFGYFTKPKIIWLGCKQTPNQLYLLQHRLGTQLACCDFQPEKRPYQPHITLYRKGLITDWPILGPIQWNVNSFSLIQSLSEKNGIIYQEIARYPLRSNGE